MSMRRSKQETYRDILLCLKDIPKGPTRIMYAANLNWARMQDFCGVLLDKGLIKRVTPLTFDNDRPITGRRSRFYYALTDLGRVKLKAIESAEI